MMTKQKKDDQCGIRRGWKEGRKGPRGVVGGGYNVPTPNGGVVRDGATHSKRLPKDRATGTAMPGAKGPWVGTGPLPGANTPRRNASMERK